MALIHDIVLNSCFYLYRDVDEAMTGSRIGGTAFNVCAEFVPGADSLLPYVVTARHNIDDGLSTLRINKVGGGFVVVDIPKQKWNYHKDGADVAVAVLSSDEKELWEPTTILWMPGGFCVTREYAEAHDIGIGDPVMMVGRLLLHDGMLANTPSVRLGSISMKPSELIPAPRGSGLPDQEAYVVEMRSIGGYSGSPVFVYESGHPPFDRTTRLLGIDYSHLASVDSENAGMAGVIPAWKIVEMLYMDEDIVAEREKLMKKNWTKLDHQGDVVTLDSGMPDDKRPGPDPERLAIDGSLENVAQRVLMAGKPKEGELDD